MIEYKVKNKIASPELCNIKIKGYHGELSDRFFEERIMSSYAQEVIYPEAEKAFVEQRDDETVAGIWKGEFWGKWMISAARVARYKNSESLRRFIRDAAKRMIGYQRADGYLGTYKNSKNVFPPTPEQAMKELGRLLLWNWNIWCRKYTLWGMLEAYLLLSDSEILESCVKMADNLIRELNELKVETSETGTFNGLASASIMKPMLILYRITGMEEYLSFCLRIADRWENADIIPAIIANSLSDKRIREWYPDSDKWAKAYEMMSCFDGLIELYRVTGVEKYRIATERFIDMLMKNEANLLGSVAFNDVFGDAGYDVNTISEPCDVIHLIRIAYEMYLLDGEGKYLDIIEKAGYNALYASVFKDGKWGARGLRGAGRHLVALMQAGMNYHHCCVNNMPRGILNFAESAVGYGDKTLYVNLYTAYEGEISTDLGRVKVAVSGDYLGEGRATLTVSGNTLPMKLRLRIPDWAEYADVTVGEATVRANGSYYETVLPIGSTEINIAFPILPRIEEVTSHPERGDIAWKSRRWIQECDETLPVLRYTPADPSLFLSGKVCVIHCGPLLLCKTKLVGCEEDAILSREITPDFKCIGCDRLCVDGVNIAFLLTLSNGSSEKRIAVSDYASGTNITTDDKHLFSIYF